MKTHEENLFLRLYTDVYGLVGADTDHRDIDYVSARIKTEGLSFLTISLPTISTSLEWALENGMWDPKRACAFKRMSCSALPSFLKGLLVRVFTLEGALLTDPCISSIWGIRQISRFFKKLEIPCSPARVVEAYQKYLRTDQEVKPVSALPTIDAERLKIVFDALFRSPLSELEFLIYNGGLIPRHGPGAVAEKLTLHGKARMPWFSRLDSSFPPELYYSPNLGADRTLEEKDFVKIGHETPARVIHVPKTLKTPRIIAIEPACIQYTQQACMQSLMPLLMRSSIGSCFNFYDQTVNGMDALKSSRDRRKATLDLSEASDRVSAGLVSYLLRGYPHLRRAFFACRSNRVSLGAIDSVERIKKFASMGSALCFPIEAMVFLSIVVLGILTERRVGLDRRRVIGVARGIRVFGDDIIVASAHAPSVILALEHFGLRVNREKSFHKGFFRESCGVDAYKGDIITPVYMTQPLPKTRREAGKVVATVSACNRLFAAGLWTTSDYMRRHLEKRIFNSLMPNVLSTSPALGLVTPWRKNYDTVKKDSALHRDVVKAWTISIVKVLDNIDGYDGLLWSFLDSSRRWSGSGNSSIPFSCELGRATPRLEAYSSTLYAVGNGERTSSAPTVLDPGRQRREAILCLFPKTSCDLSTSGTTSGVKVIRKWCVPY